MQGADSENSPLPLLFLLAPKRKAFVCGTGHYVKVLVVLKLAPKRLFVSGVILVSPSFPPGFPPPCPIRVQSSHHAGLTLQFYKIF